MALTPTPMPASRIFHVNTNCRDLGRALAFYRDLLGLTATAHPLPDRPQRGDAFGLAEVLWDGWILQGDLGYGGVCLDLLEWKVPAPGAPPPATVHDLGYHRLCFEVPDVAAVVAGVATIGGSVLVELGPDAPDGRGAGAIVADPDGTPVEICTGADRRLGHVVVNCRDLDAAVRYYRDVLGLGIDRVREEGPAVAYGTAAPARARTARMVATTSQFAVELVEWTVLAGQAVAPAPAPAPRAANDVGLFRMAWATDDCAGAEAVVRAAGSVPFAPTGPLSVGDHLPTLLVLFWPGPNGECLELIEVPGPR